MRTRALLAVAAAWCAGLAAGGQHRPAFCAAPPSPAGFARAAACACTLGPPGSRRPAIAPAGGRRCCGLRALGDPNVPGPEDDGARNPNVYASSREAPRANDGQDADEDEVARLRQEVESLRLALLKEKSRTRRLTQRERDAAMAASRDQAVAASGPEDDGTQAKGSNPVAGFFGSIGGAIYNGAASAGGAVSYGAGVVFSSAVNTSSAAVNTIVGLGANTKAQWQAFNASSALQSSRNASGALWTSALNWTASRRSKERVPARTVAEFRSLLKSGVSIDDIDVRGRSQPWRQNELGQAIVRKEANVKLDSKPNITVLDVNSNVLLPPLRGDGRTRQLQHPVLRAIWERKNSGSKPGARTDGYKIALAIEGGGLRGSVTAGMSAAVMHLGVHDCFDVVLGSSAGSIIGTYLLASQDPKVHQETTYEFFCNHLTTSREKLNGSSWLDMSRLVDLFTPGVPFAGGLGGSKTKAPSRALPKPGSVKGRFAMMALDYPMKTIMQEQLPVDWRQFEQRNLRQPIKIIASGLFSERAVMLGSEEGSFSDLASLCECVKASCMLPGVAGVEPPWLKGSSAQHPELLKKGLDQFLRQDVEASRSGELWAQARRAFMKQMRQRTLEREPPTTSALQRIFVQSADSKNLTQLPGMNKTELFAALEDLGLTPTAEEIDVLVKLSDVNFDGLIDFEEFQGMVYYLATEHLSSTERHPAGTRGLAAAAPDTLHLKTFEPQVEPMVDALLYEPIPYRSAISDLGCTHVLVLRSYPDGRRMPQGYLGLFERLVAPKCLDPFPRVKDYMINLKHSERYAEDVLRLNEGVAPALADKDHVDDAVQSDDAREVGRLLAMQCGVWEGLYEEDQVSVGSGLGPHLLAVAPLDTDGEAIRALELDKGVLLRGIMQGFARAYDLLMPDDLEQHGMRRETGDQVSKNLFLPIHYRFLKRLAAEAEARASDDAGNPDGSFDPDAPVMLPRSLIDLSNYYAKESRPVGEAREADPADPDSPAKVSVWTEGRAGRRVPGDWQAGVNFDFADSRGSHAVEFRVGEEVVAKRADGAMRFARVEAQAGDEVVVILGPDQRSSNKRDAKDVLPFQVLPCSAVGKIILDDWVEDGEEEVAAPSSSARWWKYAWRGVGNQSAGGLGPAASARAASASASTSSLIWQRGLGNFSLWSTETLHNVSGRSRPADAAARAFRTASTFRPEFAPEESDGEPDQTTGGGEAATTSGIWWTPAPRRLDTSAKKTSSSGPDGPGSPTQDYSWQNYAWQKIVKRVAQRGDRPSVDADVEQANGEEGREPPALRGQSVGRREPSSRSKASSETSARDASS